MLGRLLFLTALDADRDVLEDAREVLDTVRLSCAAELATLFEEDMPRVDCDVARLAVDPARAGVRRADEVDLEELINRGFRQKYYV